MTNLITIGAFWSLLLMTCGAARAQNLESGAPLVDGLGGPVGFGEPTDGVSAISIAAAATDGLTYYGETFDEVYVNWSGILSFGFPYPRVRPAPLPREAFQLGLNPLLAVFENSSDLPGYDFGDPDPTPAYIAAIPQLDDEPGRIVVTWHRVPDRPSEGFGEQLINDWQLILTLSDDPGRYTIEMRYSRCEWLHGFGRPENLPTAGFDAGQGRDGPGWMWPGSQTEDARLLCTLSNVREPGIFRYDVIDGVPHGCGPDVDPPPGAGRCSDGNHLPGDGCSPACSVEADADADGIYEAPDPASVDPLGVYDDCADPDDPLCFDDPDGDGVPSAIDNCDDTPNPDQANYDGDRRGDACDRDDDGDDLDEVVDPDDPTSFVDNCPLLYNQGLRQIDPDRPAFAQSLDTDRDGLGDACDTDDDDDGVLDCGDDGLCRATDNGYDDDRDGAIDEAGECAPDDALFDAECARGDRDQFDNDRDGLIDEASERGLARQVYVEPDAGEDNCRAVPNPDQSDLDGDALGDACDPDLDGDGVVNCDTGVCGPGLDFRDNDADGAIDEAGECLAPACAPDADLLDQDRDGFVDEGFEPAVFEAPVRIDNCPLVANPAQLDRDGNDIGDECDDEDGDERPGHLDNCDLQPNRDQTDTDGDGQGDACDIDDDGDGVRDEVDVCPLHADPDQVDTDGDGRGDPCENDDDDDTVPDGTDNCPRAFNRDQADLDGDGAGDVCDADQDGDAVDDADDSCPRTANVDRKDTDADGLGDACDDDDDGDGVLDADDVCPMVADRDQADLDGDRRGDACDGTDDRPFEVRSPEERCALLIERAAPTAERLQHCPPPVADGGCSATPAEPAPEPWWLMALALLGLRRPRRAGPPISASPD